MEQSAQEEREERQQITNIEKTAGELGREVSIFTLKYFL